MDYRKSLTSEELRQDLDYNPETGIFTKRLTAQSVGCFLGPKRYILVHVKGRGYLAHRLAWLYMTGEWPKDQLDHINGIKDDNRWTNLREATNGQNRANCQLQKNNTTGFKGVTAYPNGRYRARVNLNKKFIHLGYYATAEEAYAAYCKGAIEVHGAYARFK